MDSIVSSNSNSNSNSNSSSLSGIRASPSDDSDVEKTISNGLNNFVNSDKNCSSSVTTSRSSSSDGEDGFVSGGEEFETERPFVAEPDEETPEQTIDDEEDDTFVESFDGASEFPRSAIMPIAKVSSDDEEAVSPKIRVLSGEEIEGGGSVDEVGKLGSGSDSIVQGISEILEIETVVSEVEGVVDERVYKNSPELKEKSVIEASSEKLVAEPILEEPMKSASNELVLDDDVSSTDDFVAEKLVVENGGNEVIVNSKSIESNGSEAEEASVYEKIPVESADSKSEEAAEEEVNKPEIIVEAKVADEDSLSSVEPVAVKVFSPEVIDNTDEGAGIVEDTHVGLPIVPDLLENKDFKVEETEVLTDEVSLNGLGPETDEVVDPSPEGETIFEKVQAYFSRLVVDDAVENEDSETEEGDLLVGETLKHDNGFDLSGVDGEEPAEPKLVAEPGPAKQNVEVAGKDKELLTETDNNEDEKMDVPAVESGVPEVEEKSETISEQNKEEIVSAVNRDVEEIEGVNDVTHSAESVAEIFLDAEDETIQLLDDEEGEIEGSDTDGDTDGMIFGSSEAAKKFLEELELGSGSHSGAESSHKSSDQRVDGQIVTDSDEEVDTDEEGEGKELFDSAALAALLKAATGAGSDGGNITITSQDGSRLFSVERPAGLGSSMRSVKPAAARTVRPNLFMPSQLTSGGESEVVLSAEEKKKVENIQMLRVKFLRLVQRLGHSLEDSVAAQVLYRLALVAGRPNSPLFSLESAKQTALQLEAEGKDDLNFSLNILLLGKAGVGKSATINSIFGEKKTSIDAFEPATTTVKEITGVVDGVTIRVFDTPGLKSSVMEQAGNRKTLAYIKKFTKKCPPDIVLYVDRLDTQTRDLNDLPLLKTITGSLGPTIWRSAIVTLTHSASAPPDGPSGSPLSYDVFVAQRSHVVQQSIGQAVGDLRLMNPSLMNPVSLVENHSSCRKNRDGEKVLPNGQTWRPQLLLLCYSMKILSEASSLSKPQDAFDHRSLFGFRTRSPPLPYLLSWLLQPRTHPKLPSDQGADVDSDIDMDDLSDSDAEENEDEYDLLPPFKPLKKFQLAKLNKEQKKAYFEEYDYRVKLLQKKQWREELKRMKESKARAGKVGADEYGYNGYDDMDQEDGGPAAVPVALPDMTLPPSFDSDNPAYRYRFLEPTSQLLTRPVLDTHGWDHDCGYDGVNLEQTLAIANKFPGIVAVQITKDKKEFNIHLDSSLSAKHGENNSSMAGFDIQNIGKQLAYILRGETKFKILKKNASAAGFSVTFLGENVAAGFKLEDQIAVSKRLVLVGSTGTVRSQGDAAYGANVEVRLRESDYPIGQDQSTLGLSLVKWRGDLALGANLQSQFSIGRSSKMAVRVALNNKLSGQITVRTTTSDQLQIALTAIIPVAVSLYRRLWPGAGENYSVY